MEKRKFFAISTIISIALVFISGIDGLFENPLGLIATSVLLGGTIAIIYIIGFAIYSKIIGKPIERIIKDLTAEV